MYYLFCNYGLYKASSYEEIHEKGLKLKSSITFKYLYLFPDYLGIIAMLYMLMWFFYPVQKLWHYAPKDNVNRPENVKKSVGVSRGRPPAPDENLVSDLTQNCKYCSSKNLFNLQSDFAITLASKEWLNWICDAPPM